MKLWCVVAVSALALGACSSPQSQIKSACIRDGGIRMSRDTAVSAESIAHSCECFATQLAAAMPKEQLQVIADAMKEGRSRQLMSGQVLMAAKSCALS
jgi:hypothetical protein